jgi:hypothetical protein
MRSHDFIFEASLAPKTFYKRDRLQNLVKRLAEKDDFMTTDGEYVKIPVTRDELTYLRDLLRTNYDAQGNVITNKRMPNTIGGVPLSKLMKTNDFGGKGGIGAKGEAEGKANIGPTTEAMKAIAIFTRLVNRNKPSIDVNDWRRVASIMKDNATDVREKGKTVSTTSSEMSKRVYDASKKVQDIIKLNIQLSTPPFLRAVDVNEADKQAWGTLQGIINYVNSESDVQKYNRFFTNNNKRDPLNIGVVGIGGDKVDILATRTEPNGDERPLSHLSMSIKAGSSMYEQSSGMNTEGIEKLYDILGLDPLSAADAMRATGFVSKDKKKEDTPEQAKARVAAVQEIYQILGMQLETYINSKNDNGEADYIQTFLGKLKNSIQGDQRLVYVNFDARGTYNKLNPQVIDILAKHIDLGVTVDMESKSTPYIYIIDKISGKPIIHIRLAILKSGRMTNTFELDYLLDLVRDALKKNNAATAQTQQQPAVSTDTKTQQPAVSTQEKPINLGPTDAEPGKVPTKTKTGPKNKPVATTPVSDIEDEAPVKV